MALQLSAAARNARLDAIETVIGTAPVIKIFDTSGSPPANVAAADAGTVLATITLPSDWMSGASSGSKAGADLPWTDSSADNDGDADFFRVYEDDGTTCHMQGTVTATGNGGDMTVDNTSFASGQPFSITAFTLTDGNA